MKFLEWTTIFLFLLMAVLTFVEHQDKGLDQQVKQATESISR